MTAAEQFSHYARCRKVLSQTQWVILLFLATVQERAWTHREIMAGAAWSNNSRGTYTYWKTAILPLAEAGLLIFTPGQRGHRVATAQITPKGYRFLGFKRTPTATP
jgi:hypothetical protein